MRLTSEEFLILFNELSKSIVIVFITGGSSRGWSGGLSRSSKCAYINSMKIKRDILHTELSEYGD